MNWFGWFGFDGFLFWILWVLDLGGAAVGLAVLLHGRRVSVCFRGCGFAGSGLVLCLVVFVRWGVLVGWFSSLCLCFGGCCYICSLGLSWFLGMMFVMCGFM